jgi:hypothetical protein
MQLERHTWSFEKSIIQIQRQHRSHSYSVSIEFDQFVPWSHNVKSFFNIIIIRFSAPREAVIGIPQQSTKQSMSCYRSLMFIKRELYSSLCTSLILRSDACQRANHPCLKFQTLGGRRTTFLRVAIKAFRDRTKRCPLARFRRNSTCSNHNLVFFGNILLAHGSVNIRISPSQLIAGICMLNVSLP